MTAGRCATARIESGHEMFVGSLNVVPRGRSRPTTGSRASTRRTSPWRSTDVVSTRSQQAPGPALRGATGRLDFKDIIGDMVTYVYRGHIDLG